MIYKGFIRVWTGLVIACCAVVAAAAETSRPITVFAAASLGEALQEVLRLWPEDVRLSLGGSGSMARQIDQGAPADVVILASPEWMDWLESRGRLVENSRSAPLGNRLVLAGPKGAPSLVDGSTATLLERLGKHGRLAIGEHRSVPAGQYAKLWLERQGHWEALRPRLAEVENVRAALALVSRNEVPLAVLYASDIVAAPDSASVVWSIPDLQQPEIRYTLAAVTPQGLALVDFLNGPDAAATYDAFGFSTEDR